MQNISWSNVFGRFVLIVKVRKVLFDFCQLVNKYQFRVENNFFDEVGTRVITRYNRTLLYNIKIKAQN